MENQVKKSNCTTVVVIGTVFIVASIFLSPIVYGEYKYRKCIGLIDNLSAEMKDVSGDKKAAEYFKQMMVLQCYGSAFGEQ
jgi:hypothetical protein